MDSPRNVAAGLGGVSLYLLMDISPSGNPLSLLSFLILPFTILLAFLVTCVIQVAWLPFKVSRGTAIGFPIALFLLTAIGIVVLFDEPRALAAAASLGLWVAGMAAVVTYSAYADLSRKAASP